MKINPYIFLIPLLLAISCNNKSELYEELILRQSEELKLYKTIESEHMMNRCIENFSPNGYFSSKEEKIAEFEKVKYIKNRLDNFSKIYYNLNKKQKLDFIANERKNILKLSNSFSEFHTKNVKFISIKSLSGMSDKVFDSVIEEDFSKVYLQLINIYYYSNHAIAN